MSNLLIHIIKVNILGSPLKVMYKFARAVALFENKCVLEKLTILLYDINI